MNKTFLKNLDVYFNEPKDISNRPTKKYNFIIFDEEKGNYFITNSYSFIRLNNNNAKEQSKINDIIQIYGIDKLGITKTIVNFNNTQLRNNYCVPFKNFSDINDEEIEKENNKKYIEINNMTFDYNKIKHIINLIGGDGSIFISAEENRFINISGKNGYAFLLGCRTY